MSTDAPHRPVLLSVLAILVGIQAVFAIIAGFALFIERNDVDLLRHVDQSSGELGFVGIVVLVIGVVELFVATGLWRGNDFARMLATIVVSLQFIAGLYTFIFYNGTWRWQGLWQTLFAAFVLWLLFNRGAERYFRETH